MIDRLLIDGPGSGVRGMGRGLGYWRALLPLISLSWLQAPPLVLPPSYLILSLTASLQLPALIYQHWQASFSGWYVEPATHHLQRCPGYANRLVTICDSWKDIKPPTCLPKLVNLGGCALKNLQESDIIKHRMGGIKEKKCNSKHISSFLSFSREAKHVCIRQLRFLRGFLHMELWEFIWQWTPPDSTVPFNPTEPWQQKASRNRTRDELNPAWFACLHLWFTYLSSPLSGEKETHRRRWALMNAGAWKWASEMEFASSVIATLEACPIKKIASLCATALPTIKGIHHSVINTGELKM